MQTLNSSLEEKQLSQKSKAIIIVVVSIAMFMELLDATVINTSLPQIAKSLHTNPIELKVAVTTYLLSLGVFIPVSGWLADYIGERKTLILAITIFLLSSIGCALSSSLNMLVVFRLLQGMGGAFLMPIARLVLVRVYGKRDIVRAMMRVSLITMSAMFLGPLVGGAITTYIGWRWIFLLNVPFGLIGIVFVYCYLPQLVKLNKRPFDFLGFALIGGSLGSLLFSLDVVMQPDLTILEKLSALVLGIILILAYSFHARRAKNLLLNFTVFRNRTFALTVFGSLVTRFTVSTTPFLVPLMLQATYGYTAFQAGLLALPAIVGALISRRFLSPLLKLGYRRVLLSNTVCMIFIYMSYTINAFYLVIPVLIFQQAFFGFCMALQFTSMNSLAYKNLEVSQMSQGITIYSAVVQLSASFGIAFAALVMMMAIGHSDLSYHVPQIAFKVVFIAQSVFLMIAVVIFYQLREEDTG